MFSEVYFTCVTSRIWLYIALQIIGCYFSEKFIIIVLVLAETG